MNDSWNTGHASENESTSLVTDLLPQQYAESLPGWVKELQLIVNNRGCESYSFEDNQEIVLSKHKHGKTKTTRKSTTICSHLVIPLVSLALDPEHLSAPTERALLLVGGKWLEVDSYGGKSLIQSLKGYAVCVNQSEFLKFANSFSICNSHNVKHLKKDFLVDSYASFINFINENADQFDNQKWGRIFTRENSVDYNSVISLRLPIFHKFIKEYDRTSKEKIISLWKKADLFERSETNNIVRCARLGHSPTSVYCIKYLQGINDKLVVEPSLDNHIVRPHAI